MPTWLLIAFAVFFLALIPFATQLLRLRIRLLKWLHWNWAVRVLEDHFQFWTWFLRILLAVMGVVLIIVAANQ